MSYDNLWEKYGEKTEPERNANRKKTAPRGNTNGVKTESRRNTNRQKEVSKRAMRSAKEEKDAGQMPGVFGPDPGNAGQTSSSFRGRETLPGAVRGTTGSGSAGGESGTLEGVRYWPWVDIVCIAITVIMVIGVLANFEKVTTAIFYALLPLLSNLVILLLVVGLIVFVFAWISWRWRSRWWRRRL